MIGSASRFQAQFLLWFARPALRSTSAGDHRNESNSRPEDPEQFAPINESEKQPISQLAWGNKILMSPLVLLASYGDVGWDRRCTPGTNFVRQEIRGKLHLAESLWISNFLYVFLAERMFPLKLRGNIRSTMSHDVDPRAKGVFFPSIILRDSMSNGNDVLWNLERLFSAPQ